jgi:hypothetical protein
LDHRAPIGLFAPVGLAISYLLFISLSSIAPKTSVILPLYIVVILAVLSCFRRQKLLLLDAKLFFVSVGFLLPLYYLAVINSNPLWDDFTNWLPPARYLWAQGHLPTVDIPDNTRSTLNYPYLRAMFHAWVTIVLGPFSNNVQGVLNMLMASGFLLWAHELRKSQLQQKNDTVGLLSCMPLMGLFASLLTIWILTLNTRLVLGSYADPVLSLSLAGLFIYLANSRNNGGKFWHGKFDVNLFYLLLFPLLIKDTGLYFSFMIFFCFWLFWLQVDKIKSSVELRKTIRISAIQVAHFIPVFAVKWIWSFYCDKHGLNPPLSVAPFEDWNFNIMSPMLNSVLGQTLGRPYLLIGGMVSLVLILKDRYKSASYV